MRCYFCQLKPFDQRMTPALQSAPVVASVNRKLAGLPDARAFAFLPPAIPGIGQAGGVDFFIQDHAGKSVDYLWGNTQKFLDAARKRPELARMNLTFSPSVPQLFADRGQRQGVQARRVDRRRLPRAAGPAGRLLRQPVQSLRPGLEGLRRGGAEVSEHEEGRRPVLRAQQARARWSRSRRWSSMQQAFGPEYTTRFNEYRGIEIFALPRARATAPATR